MTPPPDFDSILAGIDTKSVPSLARAISLVENQRPGFETLLSRLHERVGPAHRIGITGPPGAGKSTLVDQLVEQYRNRGMTVAVVAVDPTSPFTGGAVLGDRVRMNSVAMDPGVFIRSMATRGSLGGLATTTREVCDVLDAFGFDRIVVETVGVGQTELAVTGIADTAILVLVPESGDGVQVLKAGVMEIADIFVVNKADRDGSDRLQLEIEDMLAVRDETAGGTGADDGSMSTPVLQTDAVSGQGVVELAHAIEVHAETGTQSGALAARRRVHLARHTRDVVERAMRQIVWVESEGETRLARKLESVESGAVSPYQLADSILSAVLRERRDSG